MQRPEIKKEESRREVGTVDFRNCWLEGYTFPTASRFTVKHSSPGPGTSCNTQVNWQL